MGWDSGRREYKLGSCAIKSQSGKLYMFSGRHLQNILSYQSSKKDKLAKFGEVPGGPVVRAQCFHCRRVGSAPGILQARWFSQKKILRVGWAMSGIVQASLQKEDTAAQTEVVIRDHVTS